MDRHVLVGSANSRLLKKGEGAGFYQHRGTHILRTHLRGMVTGGLRYRYGMVVLDIDRYGHMIKKKKIVPQKISLKHYVKLIIC